MNRGTSSSTETDTASATRGNGLVSWLFQGSPKRFRFDDYLSRHDYIYWSAPLFKEEISLGDTAFMWRSGKDAGLVAHGVIEELPKPLGEALYPQMAGKDFRLDDDDDFFETEVGIRLISTRVDADEGFVPRQLFLDDPTLKDSRIIKAPQGTVFRLNRDETKRAMALWGEELDLPFFMAASESIEGRSILRQHRARERSTRLIKIKKDSFKAEHGGEVFCEVCHFDFSQHYPTELGDGYIEAHHLIPLSQKQEPSPTRLEDLMLICSNCHRMVHRSKDVDRNLQLLQEHFSPV